MTSRIMVVDDDADLRATLASFLRDEGFDVVEASDGAHAVEAFADPQRECPDLVLMDVKMPGLGGIEALQKLKPILSTQLPVIVMTGYGSSTVAINAIQLGAYDYVTKPFDLDDLLLKVQRFFDWKQLSDQVVELSSRLGETAAGLQLIGNSQAMQEVYKTIGRVAQTDATVLIEGETGTGKELVAAILHRNSGYSRGPLIKVNCAALPETLLESELFGHEKGAFTGAITQRKGRFEMANKGSIFLDEVGECSLGTQKKLLRVLQEREFERVGGNLTVKVDTRIIAATNRSLEQQIAEGQFREDLFYRLNVIAIRLPPLRERTDDIPLLVEHFLGKHRLNSHSEPAKMSQSALTKLVEYDWPGNVRELENVIERAVIVCQGSIISDMHIDFSPAGRGRVIDVREQVRCGSSLAEVLAIVEREVMEEALKHTNGDIAAASELLGVDPSHFKAKVLIAT